MTPFLLAALFLTYPPSGTPKGKHIVLVSGDEEYRSEEMLPQLAKILSQRHGFQCTVLFAINPQDGTIDPNYSRNIPGLEALDTADLMILMTRFRDLPDDQAKHIIDYAESGKPIIALRTATHPFQFKTSQTYAKYNWNATDGGFGRKYFGETWRTHHGKHAIQSTHGIPNGDHPILNGVGEIWSPTDVYGIRPLGSDKQVLIYGQVLTGMKPDDPPVNGPVNDPMMPIAWITTGKQRIFTTTLGTSEDLLVPSLRRLYVNAVYWTLGLPIDLNTSVDLVGTYTPHPFKFNGFVKGLEPDNIQ